MVTLQLIGRSSSHFTRVARIFAHELGVAYELVVVYDMTAQDAAQFGQNPALKIPSLRVGTSELFGTENICRRLSELAPSPRHVVWPESMTSDVARNAHEMLWHAMAAQVQLVVGVTLGKLPAEHPYFAKIRVGFEGALTWLDAHLDVVRASLPAARDLSLFEIALFCLLEHLDFRPTIPRDRYVTLGEFARAFSTRPSARDTGYRIDTRDSR